MVAGNSGLDLFNSIMGKTLSMFLVGPEPEHSRQEVRKGAQTGRVCVLQKSMSTYVSDCYDSIAIFLCIHIILRFRAVTAKRNIPALNK